MTATYTPLRYPGGKSKLGPFMAALFAENALMDGDYVEPYAGGAGAGMHLLFRGYARRIRLNDIDPAVAAFWKSVLGQTERFADRILRVPLTVKEWDRQRSILRSDAEGFDLGFAFFYLNRTNRSGIMNGGVIGGRDQSGPWKMDARFNRADLKERVEAIGRFRRAISISCVDALDFLEAASEEVTGAALFYLDPPYYKKGRDLYTNFYKPSDHEAIAARLASFNRPWLLTYDDCAPVRELYRGLRLLSSELSYSAREVRRGREVVIPAPGLRLPTGAVRRHRHRPGFTIVERSADRT